MKTNGDHNILVCATDCGIIEFRALWNLEIYHSVKLKNSTAAITALYFSEGTRHYECLYIIDNCNWILYFACSVKM